MYWLSTTCQSSKQIWALPSWSLGTSGKNRQNQIITRNTITNCNVREKNHASYENKHPHLVWIWSREGRFPWAGAVWSELCRWMELGQSRWEGQSASAAAPASGRQPTLPPPQLLVCTDSHDLHLLVLGLTFPLSFTNLFCLPWFVHTSCYFSGKISSVAMSRQHILRTQNPIKLKCRQDFWYILSYNAAPGSCATFVV